MLRPVWTDSGCYACEGDVRMEAGQSAESGATAMLGSILLKEYTSSLEGPSHHRIFSGIPTRKDSTQAADHNGVRAKTPKNPFLGPYSWWDGAFQLNIVYNCR
ncbi:hypothetical protein Y032_0071g582 [Ancylostoma ceylanicum]|uniref:Uncharacterized protein n=1 Tax=Ancylostoma ceylanicum TaxID=53326 RepID=A0A016TW69_9BILA|nr:hypothetical protein Y032_0071g582 [Ancylostoma ceylanicum]